MCVGTTRVNSPLILSLGNVSPAVYGVFMDIEQPPGLNFL